MSPPSTSGAKEYVVRVPKNSRKKYHMMRFHIANKIDFRQWHTAKMERENNYKEFKMLDDDQPKYGAGSEFGREQRDEARRKRYGINIRKYKAERQPWLLSVKNKDAPPPTTGAVVEKEKAKKFKGIREGGVSDNVSWYVFLQAKDGAFEAYPVEEWYNFQPVNRYKFLSAEEAEEILLKREDIVNFFPVMKKSNRPDDPDGDDEGNKKKESAKKLLQLSEMDDWMSDKDTEDDDDDDEEEKKKRKKPTKKKPGKKTKKKQGGKRKRTEDGNSGTDCEEESDDFNEGAEHGYESEDSSDSDQQCDEKVTKELAGVEEGKGLKNLLNSDDEDEDEEEEEKKKKEEVPVPSDEEAKKKKKKGADCSSPDTSDSSDDEKTAKAKDASKKAATSERSADILKRKLAENPDGLLPPAKKSCMAPTSAPIPPSDSSMFEEQIRRYLVRKPMTTTEILQKLKSKKTAYSSEKLVEIIATMLKKINPQRQKVKGKMYLSLKTADG